MTTPDPTTSTREAVREALEGGKRHAEHLGEGVKPYVTLSLSEIDYLLDTLPEAGERGTLLGYTREGSRTRKPNSFGRTIKFHYEADEEFCVPVYINGTPPSSEGFEYQWYALQSDIDEMMQDESYNLLPEEFEIDPESVFNEQGEEVGAVRVLILPSSTATESGSSGIGESEPVSGDVSADSPGQARVASPSEEVEALMRERGLTEHDATEVVKFKAHLANVNSLPLDQWTGEDREYAGETLATDDEATGGEEG